MRVRVRKWGNSLALRIPKPFAVEIGMAEGGEVELATTDGSLVAVPVAPRRYTLGSLLARVTAANRHDEEDYGERAGREAW